jgi:hypothetical protein
MGGGDLIDLLIPSSWVIERHLRRASGERALLEKLRAERPAPNAREIRPRK